MHYRGVIAIIVLLLLFSSCKNNLQISAEIKNISREVSTHWIVQQEGDTKSYTAKVPGSVQCDLIHHNKLPQPFYRQNEEDFQWVDKKNWVYTSSLYIDSTDLKANKINLILHGIDTYAEIRVNDTLLLETDNMFRKWKIDVKPYVNKGANSLTVKILSPTVIGLEKLHENQMALPAVNDQSAKGGINDKKISVFTRKAPYHYGWDWGPRFLTMGIWKPVELQLLYTPCITDVYFQQKEFSAEKVTYSAAVDLESSGNGKYLLEIKNTLSGKTFATQKIELKEGKSKQDLSFSINHPELWWPNGYGDPYLYTISVHLIKGNTLIDSSSFSLGVRKIELVHDVDSFGKQFYFKVNDVPIFVKGANYIPGDNFLNRVSCDKYAYLVKSAAEANMNMLRVWGGGIYEKDTFYSLCDKHGLLVWQDFMFACSMYPGDKEFVQNVTNEAIDNIKRLRNHACLALWCGNNEIDVAWCHGKEDCGWKWKENYNADQQKAIWDSYDLLFHKVLPETVKKYNAQTPYWPSSPMADWGKTASYTTSSGDMHYWGVWHGEAPFESFDSITARFFSEYGFQSFPEFKTIKEFTLPQDWKINSDVMLAHQRSPVGNEKIKKYMKMYYPVPDGFKDFLYMGQLLQAYGIEKAIRSHRLNKPYCMGTLYWQLNDCWPVASWSGIDYYGNWKALHYKVRDTYAPTMLSLKEKGEQLQVYLLNDAMDEKNAGIKLYLSDFFGNKKLIYHDTINIKATEPQLLHSFRIDSLISPEKRNSSLILSELIINGKTMTDFYYSVKPKALHLPKTTVNMSLKGEGTQYVLRLKSDKLAKDVAVFLPFQGAEFSRNFIDLLPGSEYEINVQLKTPMKLELKDFDIYKLNDYL